MKQKTPLRRLGSPHDVANACVFPGAGRNLPAIIHCLTNCNTLDNNLRCAPRWRHSIAGEPISQFLFV